MSITSQGHVDGPYSISRVFLCAKSVPLSHAVQETTTRPMKLL